MATRQETFVNQSFSESVLKDTIIIPLLVEVYHQGRVKINFNIISSNIYDSAIDIHDCNSGSMTIDILRDGKSIIGGPQEAFSIVVLDVNSTSGSHEYQVELKNNSKDTIKILSYVLVIKCPYDHDQQFYTSALRHYLDQTDQVDVPLNVITKNEQKVKLTFCSDTDDTGLYDILRNGICIIKRQTLGYTVEFLDVTPPPTAEYIIRLTNSQPKRCRLIADVQDGIAVQQNFTPYLIRPNEVHTIVLRVDLECDGPLFLNAMVYTDETHCTCNIERNGISLISGPLRNNIIVVDIDVKQGKHDYTLNITPNAACKIMSYCFTANI